MDEIKQRQYNSLINQVAKNISQYNLESFLIYNSSIDEASKFAESVEAKLNSLKLSYPYTCLAVESEVFSRRTYPISPKPNHRLCVFINGLREPISERIGKDYIDLGSFLERISIPVQTI